MHCLFVPMNYNLLSLRPSELTSLTNETGFWHKMVIRWGRAIGLSVHEGKVTMCYNSCR
jgi:hypothetical protein